MALCRSFLVASAQQQSLLLLTRFFLLFHFFRLFQSLLNRSCSHLHPDCFDLVAHYLLPCRILDVVALSLPLYLAHWQHLVLPLRPRHRRIASHKRGRAGLSHFITSHFNPALVYIVTLAPLSSCAIELPNRLACHIETRASEESGRQEPRMPVYNASVPIDLADDEANP